MRSLFIIAILSLGACSDQGAQAQTAVPTSAAPSLQAGWSVDKAKSVLSFSAEQGGEDFTGTFEVFDAQIKFSPDDLASAKVIVDITLASADAGDIERTEALPGKDWFYVKKFPKAKFETTGFTHKGGVQYEAAADLTIRGITKSVTLPFTLTIDDGHASMQGSLSLNRRDYNVGSGMWESEEWAGHQVTVSIVLEAEKTP